MIVDSQALFGSLMAHSLSDDYRIDVAAVSIGRPDIPTLCRTMSIDVLVTDLETSEIDAIKMIRMVSSASPDTKVLVLTALADWRVLPAISAGARGYLLKNTDPEAVASAVLAVFRGESVLCREAAQWLGADAPHHPRLTRRETEVLGLVAAGAGNREIADLLQIGEKTVRNYTSRLYRKLMLRNRAQIAAFVLRGDIPEIPRASSDSVGPHCDKQAM
jgi:DNA-binding NarL/FixJ family response regulator